MDKKIINLISKIEEKNYKAIDVSTYENPNSLIKVQCPSGHNIQTSWAFMKSPYFRCAQCHGGAYKFAGAAKPPVKKDGTYRVIGLDNATEKMGVSVFDDGELVFYSLLEFDGLLEERLYAIHSVLTQVVFTQWEPNYVVFEDIQFQQNHKVYKVLGMLFGIVTLALKQKNLEHTHVQVKVWREYYQFASGRNLAKHQAIQKVKTMYSIDVNDDVAEAILIGRYAVDKLAEKFVKKGF